MGTVVERATPPEAPMRNYPSWLFFPLLVTFSACSGEKEVEDTGGGECATGTVSGTVTDASEWGVENGDPGTPQPNARVLAEDETGFSFESLADSDGNYELELNAGAWLLSAGWDQSCYGDEIEVEAGCEAAVVDLSVIGCVGR